MSSWRACSSRGQLRLVIGPAQDPQPARVEPREPTVVALLELVAVLGIGEKVREVREQVHPVVGEVALDARERAGRAALPGRDQRVAVRAASVARVDVAEARDGPVLDRAQRDLVGGIPLGVVEHPRQAEAALGRAAAVADDAVQLAEVVGAHPGPVVGAELDRREQGPVAHPRRDREERPPVAVLAQLGLEDRPLEHVEVAHRDGTRRGEVALPRVVGALLELDRAHELGNHEVEVGIALAVAVRREVDRQARDGEREVGAVVDVEAAHVVLVGLPLAAVLADDHARHPFREIARAGQRTVGQLRAGHDSARGGAGDSDQLGVARDRGQVAEGERRGHDHLRRHPKLQRGVERRLAAGLDHDAVRDGLREVREVEGHLPGPRRETLQPVAALRIAGCRRRRAPALRARLDRRARQPRAGPVRDASRHPSRARLLGMRHARAGRENRCGQDTRQPLRSSHRHLHAGAPHRGRWSRGMRTPAFGGAPRPGRERRQLPMRLWLEL